MLKPRAAVSAIPAYHPPLAGRAGLRLDFNENTVGGSFNGQGVGGFQPRNLTLDWYRMLFADDAIWTSVFTGGNRENSRQGAAASAALGRADRRSWPSAVDDIRPTIPHGDLTPTR